MVQCMVRVRWQSLCVDFAVLALSHVVCRPYVGVKLASTVCQHWIFCILFYVERILAVPVLPAQVFICLQV